jgi:uncharacterized protein YecT (DUF1311 family)
MSMLRQRGLGAVAVALMLGASACSEQPRDARDAVADTMTTPTMRRELSSDLRAAEQALQQIQDSVDVALGPELAMRLHPLREAFVTYRKQQCELLKDVFKDGTYGAVAELECLIHLTDSRREFIEEHYDFIEKIGERGRGNRRAKPDHGAAGTP